MDLKYLNKVQFRNIQVLILFRMQETGGGNPGFQSDTLSLITGKRYKASFWYYKVSGTASWFMNGGEASSLLSSVGAWTYVAAEFTRSTSTTIDFSFTGNAEVYIDDVSIKEVKGYESLGWSFDGVDDKVDCGSDESISVQSSFTVCVWVRPTKAAGLNGILMGRIGSGAGRDASSRDQRPESKFAIMKTCGLDPQ